MQVSQIINELKKHYNGQNIENFVSVINNIDIEWLVHRSFKDISFNKHLLYFSDAFEIILIEWKKGHKTLYHDHPLRGCVMKVLSGCLEETRMVDGHQTFDIMTQNKTKYMHDIYGVHMIKALEDSYSLHIYSPSGHYN